MPNGWTLAWGDEHRRVEVKDAAHLNELLTAASEDAATSRTIAELVSPTGAEMTIGLGRGFSIATFKASADPPYFVSRGTGSPDESLVFFFGGDWSEFSGDEAITLDDASAALQEFFETGQRPTCIAWRKV